MKYYKCLAVDRHLGYLSYEVYVNYRHLSSANENPGIRGQQVQIGINLPTDPEGTWMNRYRCFNIPLQLRVNDDKMCIIGNAVLSEEVKFPDSEDILSATKVIY